MDPAIDRPPTTLFVLCHNAPTRAVSTSPAIVRYQLWYPCNHDSAGGTCELGGAVDCIQHPHGWCGCTVARRAVPPCACARVWHPRACWEGCVSPHSQPRSHPGMCGQRHTRRRCPVTAPHTHPDASRGVWDPAQYCSTTVIMGRGPRCRGRAIERVRARWYGSRKGGRQLGE